MKSAFSHKTLSFVKKMGQKYAENHQGWVLFQHLFSQGIFALSPCLHVMCANEAWKLRSSKSTGLNRITLYLQWSFIQEVFKEKLFSSASFFLSLSRSRFGKSVLHASHWAHSGWPWKFAWKSVASRFSLLHPAWPSNNISEPRIHQLVALVSVSTI